MSVRGRVVILSLPLIMGFMQVVPVSNARVWISDILANPARFWNVTVVVVGQVQAVTANPAGTTRGTYTVLDDSSPNPLTVRSRDLPPIGREYEITGVIIQDPAQAGVPLLDELERADPGMSTTMRVLLIGGVVLFAGLLIALVVVLLRPKRAIQIPTPAYASPAPSPSFSPAQSSAGGQPTRKLTSTPPSSAAAPADHTRVFQSLGVELEIEKGPDKGKVFTIHKSVTTIGRAGARRNEVELSDDTVSKEQASIFYDAQTQSFTLDNESTTNPTTVAGKLVTETAVLEPGSAIQMGSTVIRFRKA